MEKNRDPVCGKFVGEPQPVLCSDYKSRRYYFCSEKCKRAFSQRAEKLRIGELARAGALFSSGQIRWGLS